MGLVILGGGESGVGAAILAKRKGLEPFVSDRGQVKKKYKDVLNNNGIEWEEGKHDEARILKADEVIKSPGISDTVPLIVKLREQGVSVISEIEFGSRYTDAYLIGITGSNGKTTTAMLIHHMLKKAGLKVGLTGNIGKSFAWQIAEEDQAYYVIELSSFQLDGIETFRPNVAVLLNITPDHLDRYEYKMEKYVASKFRIGMNQEAEDHFIFCDDDLEIEKGMKGASIKAQQYPFSIKHSVKEGAQLNNEQIQITINNYQTEMSIHDLALQGKHNLYNSMASGIAGRILDLRKELIRESLSDFQNVEHRLEYVASVHGIEFINDSKATNVNSTWYALESLHKEVVWIVGGVDKGNDYSQLDELVKDKVKAIICLGKDNGKIIDAFQDIVPVIDQASSAKEAVAKSYQYGSKGDVVLLSPACASFDLFENYEDRGHQFKRAVRAL